MPASFLLGSDIKYPDNFPCLEFHIVNKPYASSNYWKPVTGCRKYNCTLNQINVIMTSHALKGCYVCQCRENRL